MSSLFKHREAALAAIVLAMIAAIGSQGVW